MIVGILFASSPVLAWFSYQQGVNNERVANAQAANEATALETCFGYVQETGRTAVFATIPDDIKEACGLPSKLEATGNTMIVSPGTAIVQLPDETELSVTIESLRKDSRDFNNQASFALAATGASIGIGFGTLAWFTQNK